MLHDNFIFKSFSFIFRTLKRRPSRFEWFLRSSSLIFHHHYRYCEYTFLRFSIFHPRLRLHEYISLKIIASFHFERFLNSNRQQWGRRQNVFASHIYSISLTSFWLFNFLKWNRLKWKHERRTSNVINNWISAHKCIGMLHAAALAQSIDSTSTRLLQARNVFIFPPPRAKKYNNESVGNTWAWRSGKNMLNKTLHVTLLTMSVGLESVS